MTNEFDPNCYDEYTVFNKDVAMQQLELGLDATHSVLMWMLFPIFWFLGECCCVCCVFTCAACSTGGCRLGSCYLCNNLDMKDDLVEIYKKFN